MKSKRCPSCGLRLQRKGEEWRPGHCICVHEVATVSAPPSNQVLIPEAWNPLGIRWGKYRNGSFFFDSGEDALKFCACGLYVNRDSVLLGTDDWQPGYLGFRAVSWLPSSRIVHGIFLGMSVHNAARPADLARETIRLYAKFDWKTCDWCLTC